MNLRIMGTSEEVKEVTELLPAILNVSSISKEYPNRGSNEVRVYVDGCVEGSTISQAFKNFAEFKSKHDKMAMLLIVASEDGNIKQMNTSTNATAFKNLIGFILSDYFNQTIKETIQKAIIKNDSSEVQ